MHMNNNCVNKTVDVFMDKSVVNKINALIHRDPFHECGGIFIGNVSADQVTGKHTVHVHDLYFEERLGTGSTFEFTTDYLMNAVKYVKKNCPEYHIVGNIHSHAQFQAFWSGQDKEMMSQARDNSFYMVVSPKYGTWEAIFKDIDFNYYHCDIKIADDTCCEYMFGKSVEADEMRSFRNGRPYQTVTYRVNRSYTDVQRRELDKRFLHSITELSGKKVLIVGAGTVGNLLAEYAMNSGISNLCIVDMDAYHYWNLPRSSMIGEHAQEKPKALELAKAIAERSYFPIQVTGINADICELGWGFFKDFDLVLSPVDSASIRQYVDRGCKLYRIPHITCGTGIIDGDFTGNVVAFPSHAVVDLEYVWGTCYRANLEERRSCSDIAEETQAQVMGFSAQIAGITMDLALKYLLGKIEDNHTVWKYILNAVGNGFARDKAALRTFKYGKMPATAKSELYEVFNTATEITTVRFDRSIPKHMLWEQLNELFGEDIFSYGLNLEWSLNIPVAYRSTNAYARIEVSKDSGVDEVLYDLPDCHVYLVEGDEKNYLIELQFVDCGNKET